ncbi:MAG TPA: hypothetical protein VFG54_14340 [Prolixibacteraceae bacterium]|nr:hypothetical protein [Prolixibacteraceae bacterium]
MAPNVYYFNPTCELAIANGSFSYMPPKLLRDFETDCSVLPFVFSSAGDCILTECKPSQEFISRLSDAGFTVPTYLNLKELVSEGNLGHLFPWGWSPASHFILKDLKDKCCQAFKESPVYDWKEEHKSLFERRTSLTFLQNFLETFPSEHYLDTDNIGISVTSCEEIELLLKKHTALVLKAPLSSSGRGIQIIRKPTLNASNRQWISGVLNQQAYLIAEPYLDKITDLSFQFKITDKGEPEYPGYSIFETNTNGQYKSTFIHPKVNHPVFSGQSNKVEELIATTAELLARQLKYSPFAMFHRGFMGIDAMLYRDQNQLKMQPCIEINSRMNMGILTLHIEKYIHPHSIGKFELFYDKPGEYHRFATQQAMEKPLKMKNGLLSSGFLSLVEPDETKQFGAYILLQDSV